MGVVSGGQTIHFCGEVGRVGPAKDNEDVFYLFAHWMSGLGDEFIAQADIIFTAVYVFSLVEVFVQGVDDRIGVTGPLPQILNSDDTGDPNSLCEQIVQGSISVMSAPASIPKEYQRLMLKYLAG